MRRFAFILLSAMLFTACSTQQQLYTWSDYHVASYNYLNNSDEASIAQLIKTYDKIITKQKGTRNTVPPGIYADYGLILLQLDKVTEAEKMFQKEIELYPESKAFLERILKMIEK